MDAHAQHRLQKSIRAMAVDVNDEIEARRRAVEAIRLREMEQQLQIEVEGTATPMIAGMTVDVAFDVAFTTSNGLRVAHLDRPHVWFGFEQTFVSAAGQPTDVAVMLAATVVGWKRQRNSIVGASVAISALAPAVVDFRGLLHATFQGLGAPQDEPDLEG
jgi:hypothetical protein